jgi:hypothetical protein
MCNHLARQMLGQWTPRRLEHIDLGHRRQRISRLGGLLFLAILQHQFKLGDGGVQSLRRAAKMHPPQFGKLGLQTSDRRRLRRDQRTRFFWQSGDVQCHGGMIAASIASQPMTLT